MTHTCDAFLHSSAPWESCSNVPYMHLCFGGNSHDVQRDNKHLYSKLMLRNCCKLLPFVLLGCSVIQALLYVPQPSIDGEKKRGEGGLWTVLSSLMHQVENWGWSKWQPSSESRLIEENSKVRVYSYSNVYHGFSKVLNVMRKCQPAGKIRFHTRFAIICSGWGSHGCLTCFNGMSEERTDYADIICVNKPEKPQRELPFHSGLRLSLFFL